MNDGPLTPAEHRLAALLALLRSDLVRGRPVLVDRVMNRVRWQRVLRDVLGAVGTFASTVAQGVTMLMGRAPRGGAGR